MRASDEQDPTNADRARAAVRYLWSLMGPLLALVVVVLLFAVLDNFWSRGKFSSARNARTVVVQTCVVAVAALGMTVVIISGGIDLSAGAALALCATTLAWGLRVDVGFMLLNGDSIASVSRRMDRDQKKLKELIQKQWDEYQDAEAERKERLGQIEGAEGEREKVEREKTEREEAERIAREQAKKREYWELRIAREKQRLLVLAKQKLAHIEYLQKASSPSDAVRLAIDLRRMEDRIQKLRDPKFVLVFDSSWLDGFPNSPLSGPIAVVIALATGLLAGLANGLLISSLRVVPFIVTLGTMTIFLGLGNLLSGNVPIRPTKTDQVPPAIASIVSNHEQDLWLGFPTGVWLLVLLAMGLALMLKYTVFGRHVFALGSNEATARLCGINVPRTKIAIYAIGGLFLAVAGICQFSRLSSGNPMAGVGLELKIIAAVIIGGASLNGGRGTVLGTLAGAAIMAVIESGCTQLGLDDAVQRIILGVVIIGAVVVDQVRQRRSA